MNKSEKVDRIVPALVKALHQMKPAIKDEPNTYRQSKFASMASVFAASKPALEAHGLAIIQFPVSSEAGVGVETVVLHESGQWIAGEYVMPLKAQTGEAAAGNVTYASRYAWLAVCALVREDDDGQGAARKADEEIRLALAALRGAASEGMKALTDAWAQMDPRERDAIYRMPEWARIKDAAAKASSNRGQDAAAP